MTQAIVVVLACALGGPLLVGLVGAAGPRWGPLPAAAWAAIAVVALNALAFVPAARARTERFYDLVGALSTLLSCALLATTGSGGPLRWLFLGLPALWALRLGVFLARRAHREGDGRFDAIKQNPARFAVAWALQSLWVNLTNLAVTAAVHSPAAPAPGPVEALGFSLWVVGFAVEATADAQKTAFRAVPAHHGRFIGVGLWAWCRHPNYFGEILLWSGLFLAATPRLHGVAWLALASPLFVFGLLRFGSGVPLLEARAAARWGQDPSYQAYLRDVPRLFPRPPRRSPG